MQNVETEYMVRCDVSRSTSTLFLRGLPDQLTKAKKAVIQIQKALMFYVQNSGMIKENEWGFFAAGLLIGVIASSVFYILTDVVTRKKQSRPKQD